MLDYLTTILILLLNYILYKLCYKKWKLPPGPKPWPIIGNYRNLYSEYGELVDEWRKKYGPIITFYRYGTRFVYISDYDIGYKAFVQEHPDLLAGRPNNGIDKLSVGNMEVFFTRSMSPEFKELRKMIMSSLRQIAAPGKMTDISNKAFDLFKELVLKDPEFIDNMDGYYVEDLNYWIGHNLLVGCFWAEPDKYNGYEYNTTISLKQNLQEAVGNVQYFDQMPGFLMRLPFPPKQHVLNMSTKFSNYINEKIQVRRSSKAYLNPKYFIDIALQIQDEQNSSTNPRYPNLPKFDDFFIANLAIDNYLAGMDAFGIGFTWIVGVLATHPEIGEKIREEYYRIKSQNESKPFHLWMDDMHYTNAMINEIYRFNSLSTLTSFHRALGDCKVNGYDIPKDTIVALDIMSMHFNPKDWPEPYKFQPERFLDNEGMFKKPRSGFMPFGVGKRTCVAERYTVKESHYVFVVRLSTELDIIWTKKNEHSELIQKLDPLLFRRCEEFYIRFVERKQQGSTINN